MGTSATADEVERELLREEMRRGHAVGNHTMHHYFLCGHSTSSKRRRRSRERRAHRATEIGQRPELFRTPYGAHCPQLKQIFDGLGIKPIGWDIDPQDWKLKNAPKIEAYIEESAAQAAARRATSCSFTTFKRRRWWRCRTFSTGSIRRTRAAWPRARRRSRSSTTAYLVPPHKLIPPFLDALGRVLVDHANSRRCRRSTCGPETALRLPGRRVRYRLQSSASRKHVHHSRSHRRGPRGPARRRGAPQHRQPAQRSQRARGAHRAFARSRSRAARRRSSASTCSCSSTSTTKQDHRHLDDPRAARHARARRTSSST